MQPHTDLIEEIHYLIPLYLLYRKEYNHLQIRDSLFLGFLLKVLRVCLVTEIISVVLNLLCTYEVISTSNQIKLFSRALESPLFSFYYSLHFYSVKVDTKVIKMCQKDTSSTIDMQHKLLIFL